MLLNKNKKKQKTLKIHENILNDISFGKECKSLMKHPHQLMKVMCLKFWNDKTVTFEILL